MSVFGGQQSEVAVIRAQHPHRAQPARRGLFPPCPWKLGVVFAKEWATLQASLAVCCFGLQECPWSLGEEDKPKGDWDGQKQEDWSLPEGGSVSSGRGGWEAVEGKALLRLSPFGPPRSL